MDNSQARSWLNEEWASVLRRSYNDPDPEVDSLVDSKVQSVRYALFTQLLGKIADSNRNILCCQSETGMPGAWDARSFCSTVIVPWVSENQNVLGRSQDPYVSNPLRRPILSRNMPGTRSVDSADWATLFDLLNPLEKSTHQDRQIFFRRCLQSLTRRLARQNIQYPIPNRVSALQTRSLLEAFLAEQSCGLRSMAVATALIRTGGQGFNLFARIEAQGVTESDAASGVPGDLMCYDEQDHLSLVIEVKDRSLTYADVQSSMHKARSCNQTVTSFLFLTAGVNESEQNAIDSAIVNAWSSGLNLYQAEILELSQSCFSLLSEEWRYKFLCEIGEDLDRRGQHYHRLAWHGYLSSITSASDNET